jgi:(2Fe-2S) ferredoxin
LVEFENVDRIVKEVHCEERVVTRVGDGKMCSEARAVLKRYSLLS